MIGIRAPLGRGTRWVQASTSIRRSTTYQKRCEYTCAVKVVTTVRSWRWEGWFKRLPPLQLVGARSRSLRKRSRFPPGNSSSRHDCCKSNIQISVANFQLLRLCCKIRISVANVNCSLISSPFTLHGFLQNLMKFVVSVSDLQKPRSEP